MLWSFSSVWCETTPQQKLIFVAQSFSARKALMEVDCGEEKFLSASSEWIDENTEKETLMDP